VGQKVTKDVGGEMRRKEDVKGQVAKPCCAVECRNGETEQQGKSNILFNGLTVARVENVNVED
jgi:hypothetical protein